MGIKYYTLSSNTDRDEVNIDFDGDQPPIGAVLKIEEELLWRGPDGLYSRAIGLTFPDRYFAGTNAVMVGHAEIQWEDGVTQP